MKKAQQKKRKLFKRKNHVATDNSTRITNETIAKHREKILAGGRRFKYPYQYAKHKLVINTIAIVTVVVVCLVGFGWWQLYKAQNTGEFIYRVTRVVPVPIGSADGEPIRYSDYLMRYRSQQFWLQSQNQLGLNSQDANSQLDYIKRKVFDNLAADMYAQKLAHERNISVSDQEVQRAIDAQRKTATGTISQQVYDNSNRNILSLEPEEYRHILAQSILQQKVAYTIDKQAQSTRDQVSATLFNSNPAPSLQDVVKMYAAKNITLDFGVSGMVAKDNKDGGLTQQALKMKDGEISHALQSTTGDGYYFIQRLQATDQQVSYQFIRIRLTVFSDQLQKLKKQGKIHEYISLPKVNVKGIN